MLLLASLSTKDNVPALIKSKNLGAVILWNPAPKATGEGVRALVSAWAHAAKEGAPVDLFTLRNSKGLEARISNYGGIVVSFKAPDRYGVMGDVVLGYDNLDGYLTNNPFFGCLVGRYGNRIARGKFTLDGKEYTLAVNNGPNALHGGLRGFDKVVWDAQATGDSLVLNYLSPNGDQGFPGNLHAQVTYSLTGSELRIEYSATTDAAKTASPESDVFA